MKKILSISGFITPNYNPSEILPALNNACTSQGATFIVNNRPYCNCKTYGLVNFTIKGTTDQVKRIISMTNHLYF